MGDRGRLRHRLVGLAVALAIVGAGCGGDDAASSADDIATTDAPSTTTAATSSPDATTAAPTTTAAAPTTTAAATREEGTCTVTITGAREETWTFGQAITSFSTDYWMSEEELREVVEFLGEDITGGSYEDLVARGEPFLTFLQISCSDPDNLIQGALVAATNATRAGDLPMGPGSYPITGGLFDADGPAGTMIADLSVSEDELYGTVAGSGSLEITRWDLAGIEGSFSFQAREAFVDDPGEVSVTVEFSFVCASGFSGC